jgi:transcriptional regulator with XRE-family HTH domain
LGGYPRKRVGAQIIGIQVEGTPSTDKSVGFFSKIYARMSSVMARNRVRTKFGELLERYRLRAGLSQQAFANAMSERGYPSFSQRLYSHILYNPRVRIYPQFFALASEILGLSFSEQQELLQTWLSLADQLSDREEEIQNL